MSSKVGLAVQEPRSERDQIDDSEFQGNDEHVALATLDSESSVEF